MTYSAGADFWLTKRITVAADIIGEQVFQARRTTMTTFTELGKCHDSGAELCDPAAGFDPPKVDPVISQTTESYNASNLSLGVRLKPFGSLLVTGNVLIKINDGGLRARFIPLVGLSYAF